MNSDIIFIIICVIILSVMMIYYMRRERKILSVAVGALTGIMALFILNRYGEAFGADMPLNIFNITGSAVLGVPFVVGLVIFRYAI